MCGDVERGERVDEARVGAGHGCDAAVGHAEVPHGQAARVVASGHEARVVGGVREEARTQGVGARARTRPRAQLHALSTRVAQVEHAWVRVGERAEQQRATSVQLVCGMRQLDLVQWATGFRVPQTHCAVAAGRNEHSVVLPVEDAVHGCLHPDTGGVRRRCRRALHVHPYVIDLAYVVPRVRAPSGCGLLRDRAADVVQTPVAQHAIAHHTAVELPQRDAAIGPARNEELACMLVDSQRRDPHGVHIGRGPLVVVHYWCFELHSALWRDQFALPKGVV